MRQLIFATAASAMILVGLAPFVVGWAAYELSTAILLALVGEGQEDN